MTVFLLLQLLRPRLPSLYLWQMQRKLPRFASGGVGGAFLAHANQAMIFPIFHLTIARAIGRAAGAKQESRGRRAAAAARVIARRGRARGRRLIAKRRRRGG